MTDISDELANIFRGAGVVFLGTVLGRGFSFIAQILIANALLPERLGDLGIAITIVTMLGTASLFGVPKAIPRQMSESIRDEQGVVTAGLIISLVFGSISAAAVFLFPSIIAQIFGSPQAATVLRPLTLYLLFYPVSMVTTSGLRGLKKSTETVVVREIIGPVFPLFLFICLNYFGYPFVGAIVYYLAIQVVVAVVGTVLLFRHFDFQNPIETVQFRELWDLFSFAWPLAISTNLLLVMANLDILMIGYFIGSESAGYYKIIQPLGKLVLLPSAAFTFLYLPIVTQYYDAGDMEFLSDVFSATAKWISFLTFPLLLVFSLFPESIIQTFYRAEYLPAASALTVYALGMFGRIIVGPNGAMVKAIDRTRLDMVSALAGVVTNVFLNVILIPPYGIVGAAVATGIGFLIYNISEVTIVYYSIGIHPFLLDTVKPLFVTAVVVVIIRIQFLPDRIGIVGVLMTGIAIGVFEIGSIVLTQSLDSQDRLLLNRVSDQLNISPDRFWD